MIKSEARTKKRYVIDTSVLINYLTNRDREVSENAIFAISNDGKLFISIFSLMEFWQYDGKKQKIKKQINLIEKLSEDLDIEVLACSTNAQKKAIELIESYSSNIGKSFVVDCLIASTAIMRRATLVTADKTWSTIGDKIKLRAATPP